MHLRGYHVNEETGDVYYVPDDFPTDSPDAPAPSSGGLPLPAPTQDFPTGGTNWINDLLKTGMSVWGQVKAARAPQQPVVPQYGAGTQLYPYRLPVYSQTGPALPVAGGSLFGISSTTLLMLAVAGAAVYLIAKK